MCVSAAFMMPCIQELFPDLGGNVSKKAVPKQAVQQHARHMGPAEPTRAQKQTRGELFVLIRKAKPEICQVPDALPSAPFH